MIRRIVFVAAAMALAACTSEEAPTSAPTGDTPMQPSSSDTIDAKPALSLPTPYFDEIASDVGLDFEHFLGATGEYFFPEIAASGVALFDADNDGDLDLYAVQGAMLAADASPADSVFPYRGDGAPVNRFFRNELVPTGTLRFVDATEQSGLGDASYGMGVITGDVDNDGDMDVVVTNFGQNALYENRGDGTFRVVPGALAVDDAQEWTTSASFADIDRDGDLDLFATNYVGYTVGNNIRCTSANGEREYCGPNSYPPTVDRLWRNDGDLTFTDITVESGIGAAAGNGLGTSATDFDGDGDLDVYVANDLMENRLWTQDAQGRFTDTALMAGSAYNGSGAAEASMGVTAGDFDGDGDEDLFMTHLAAETNTLYLNDGEGNFFDITDSANLAAASLRLTGFGTGWIDFDNDGWLDLFIANGAVTAVDDAKADAAWPYGQINQLLRNDNGRFKDVTPSAGANFALREVGRGAAFGDVDNDGAVDVAVLNANGPLRLLRNRVGADAGHWLRVKVVGSTGSRDGAGTRLALTLSDGRVLWRRAHTDGSYVSASDIRVHFGVGDATPVSLRAVWPRGGEDTYPLTDAVDIELTLMEGEGLSRRGADASVMETG